MMGFAGNVGKPPAEVRKGLDTIGALLDVLAGDPKALRKDIAEHRAAEEDAAKVHAARLAEIAEAKIAAEAEQAERLAALDARADEVSALEKRATAAEGRAAKAQATIDEAGKIALEGGARLVIVEMISGAIYAYSGLSGDANITSGQGYYCAEGRPRDIPVGSTDGVRHTHLLVVPAA